MELEIELLPEASSVFLNIEGELSVASRLEALKAGTAELRSNQYKGLIIDVTNAYFGPDEVSTDALTLITGMESLGLNRGALIALIHPEPDERREYFTSVAEHFSFQLDYFPTLDKALAWVANTAATG